MPETRAIWNYRPQAPLRNSPVFAWPPRPRAAIWWVMRRWVNLSSYFVFMACALGVYFYAQPEMSTMKVLSLEWIALIYVRNLVLMIVITGALHLRLVTFGAQGKKLKFDARDMIKNNRTFTFKNQVHDNMFWTIASGVTAWTFFEVLFFWAAANGYAPVLSFRENPILSISALVWIPILSSMHFYWIHRLLHWPPLYRLVHALHHRNLNIGPWSGMSMHPFESLGYMSALLLHFVIPTHPIFVLWHFYTKAIGPSFSHAGFEKVLLKDESGIDAGDFHHQLHHRFFECNYGTLEMPWDKWFGSFHDGTDEANEQIKERRRRMNR
jgi:sterol desaturase/sphingolipid hydroxylase (fatty acid hydroxylase superfamily)